MLTNCRGNNCKIENRLKWKSAAKTEYLWDIEDCGKRPSLNHTAENTAA